MDYGNIPFEAKPFYFSHVYNIDSMYGKLIDTLTDKLGIDVVKDIDIPIAIMYAVDNSGFYTLSHHHDYENLRKLIVDKLDPDKPAIVSGGSEFNFIPRELHKDHEKVQVIVNEIRDWLLNVFERLNAMSAIDLITNALSTASDVTLENEFLFHTTVDQNNYTTILMEIVNPEGSYTINAHMESDDRDLLE